MVTIWMSVYGVLKYHGFLSVLNLLDKSFEFCVSADLVLHSLVNFIYVLACESSVFAVEVSKQSEACYSCVCRVFFLECAIMKPRLQEAMALQNPYIDIQIVIIAKNLIESTGFYTMDCREWNRTDKAQKTRVNFKLHFSQVFRENRDHSRQAQHAGYGQSNTQNSANAAMLSEMTQDHSHALANIAMATQSDRTTVANM